MPVYDTSQEQPRDLAADYRNFMRAVKSSGGLVGQMAELSGMPNPATNEEASALFNANIKAALDRQKEVERTSTPFPQPGAALKANNLVPESYAPSGTIFTGGVPYKPNYAAQETAAAGMLLANLMESYAKNRKTWSDSQNGKS